MFLNVDKLYLTPKIDKIDDRYRVELYSVSMNKYTCVDATVQKDLYEDLPTITPVGLLRWVAHLISQVDESGVGSIPSHTSVPFFHGGDDYNHEPEGDGNTHHNPEWSGTTHE